LYCYFDPDEVKRSLGVFNVLWTIDFVREQRIPYLYLGYYIRECAKMNYKIDYRPCEVLVAEGTWQRWER
jgi:arginine-tRNA-protein transferase